MANWVDVLSLLATLCLIGGTIYACLCAMEFCRAVGSCMQESLRMKGVHVSQHGASISVSSRLQPDDCMKIAIDMLHRNPRPHHLPSTLHAPSKASTHSFPLHLHAPKHFALDVGRRYPRVGFAPSVM